MTDIRPLVDWPKYPTGLMEYDLTQCVSFKKATDPFGALTLRQKQPLWVVTEGGALKAPSPEALYQACRYPNLPGTQRALFAFRDPQQCRMHSEHNKWLTRPHWEEQDRPSLLRSERDEIMWWVLCLRAQQHSEFRTTLLATEDRTIVANLPRGTHWGCVPHVVTPHWVGGYNRLGILLQALRDVLTHHPHIFEVVGKPYVDDTRLLGHLVTATPWPLPENLPQLG